MIITRPEQFNVGDLFIDVSTLVDGCLLLKCEGMNFAGSIKLKTAIALIEHGERTGALLPGSTLIESSSGNLGIAMSMVAAARGYPFICVTDTRCNDSTLRLMRAYGARVEIVSVADPVTGLLGARLDRVRALLVEESDRVWLNQYKSPANPDAHARTTAAEILGAFERVDVLFVGVGTSGTAMGSAKRFRESSPDTTIVAVDSVGSVSFGGPSLPRHIPGLGAGVVPPQLSLDVFDELVSVEEEDTLRMCGELVARGFLFGGSTGTVLAAARDWYRRNPERSGELAVAIGPDLGERYLESVYDERWREQHYPRLGSTDLVHGSVPPALGVPSTPRETSVFFDRLLSSAQLSSAPRSIKKANR